jgi:CBS domain-containing protein
MISMVPADHTLLAEIMTRKVVTIDISERVEEALRLMVKYDIGSVIVMDKEKPMGIITERDIARAALRGDSILRSPARSLMSRPLQSATPDLEVWRAFEFMLKIGARRLPIIEDGKLVGIVTEKDLTRWVLRIFYEPNMPKEIQVLARSPKIEILENRTKCPNCGQYQDECICLRTESDGEE